MRTDLTFEIPPGRIASSTSATGASRTCSQRRQALAQAQVGDVAVAVVGRLREHRQHELGDRIAVRAHQRDAVHLAQAVADPHDPRARRRRPAAADRLAGGGGVGRARAHRITVSARAPPAISSAGARGERPQRRDRFRCPPDGGRAHGGCRSSGAALAHAGAGAARLPARALYLHGVPTTRDEWLRVPASAAAGWRSTCRASGARASPATCSYTIDEYDRFIERFLDETGVERVQLVVHDWGAVGLAFAQRLPERVERLVIVNAVPFLPGYRWHRTARVWRTPGLGELAMGTTDRSIAAAHLPGVQRDAGTDAGGVAGQRARALRPGHTARDPAPVSQLAPRGAGGSRRAAGRRWRCPRWSCGA